MKNMKVARRYYTVKEACEEMHITRNTLMKLALDAEAIMKIGSRGIRIDMPKLYDYMDLMNTVKE